MQADPVSVRLVQPGQADGGGQACGPIGQIRQHHVLGGVDQQLAHDDARDVAHAAQHDHDQNRHGDDELEIVRADQRELRAIERAGKTGE